MFVGSVPEPVVEQIIRVSGREWWTQAFVCCSGSFRVDSALKAKWADLAVHSNDVSLLTVALGRLATKDALQFTFTERLAFIEEILEGRQSPFERVSALLVALDMARYKGQSEHAKAHFRHYQANFNDYLGKANKKVAEFLLRTKIDSFYAGDFREHASRGARAGGCIVAFPPTYKSGYERLYKFVDDNTTWERPAYEIWDPKLLEAWVQQLDDAGARYCVFGDRRFENLKPALEFTQPSNRPIHVYANFAGSSVRRWIRGTSAMTARWRSASLTLAR